MGSTGDPIPAADIKGSRKPSAAVNASLNSSEDLNDLEHDIPPQLFGMFASRVVNTGIMAIRNHPDKTTCEPRNTAL
jgi:hypothetical protein